MSEPDIFASSTCDFNISTVDHMKKLTNNAFVGNTGHVDNLAGSEGLEGMKVDNIKPQKIVVVSPVGHSVIMLGVRPK